MAVSMQTNGVAAAYDKWAPVYDLVFGSVFKNGRQQAIDAAERVGGRILEVGVGTGISLPKYANENRLVGVDISESMLEKARERVRKLKLDNVEAIEVMDAERLAFADESFDVVVAQYVVTAVPNPEAALDEFARVREAGRRDHHHHPDRRRGRPARQSREDADAGHQQARLAHRIPVRPVRSLGRAPARGPAARAPLAPAAWPFLAYSLW